MARKKAPAEQMAAVPKEKIDIAVKAAQSIGAQLEALNPDVRFLALELLTKSMFVTQAKPEHRLRVYDMFSKSIREDIKVSQRRKMN